jgi:PAS domain S-box-containing protein
MAEELRKTGIRALGEISWGTHICHFYDSSDDLPDILIPYFKSGLAENELCLWIYSEPFTEAEARRALQQAIPEAETLLTSAQLQLISFRQWYLKDGAFDGERVLRSWKEKTAEAQAGGFAGLRVLADEAWLSGGGQGDFSRCEKGFDEAIDGQPLLLLCAFPLASAGAAAILDVTRNHQLALVRRGGEWEAVESQPLQQAKAESKDLNQALEQRVRERTRELAASNQELRREIAERRRAEEAERASQQQYEALVQSIDGIVWEVDAQTFRFTFISKQAERILGYPLERWLNEENFWAEHLHPDDRNWAVGFCTDAVARRLDHQFEYRMIAADGRPVWLRDIVTVHVLDDQSVHLRGVMVNVSKRKRTEEALRESQRRFSDTLTNLEMIAVMTDASGSLTFCNDYLLRLTGWQRDETLGRSWFELFLPEADKKRVKKLFQTILEDGAKPPHFEYEIETRSGERRMVKWTNTTLRDLGGRAIGIAALGDDITERMRAEARNDKLLHTLGERVKELSTLHGLARLLQQEGVSSPALLGQLCELLPAAFQYPEITAVRVRLDGMEVTTANFTPLPAKLQADFTTRGGKTGSIEVVYLESRPAEAEGAFLAEERTFINTAADMLRSAYDRKQTEIALRESEARFRQLTENIREVFWLRTPDLGEMLYISSAYESIWGQSLEGLYREPHSFIEAIHPEDRLQVAKRIEQTWGQGFEVEYRIIKPDGSERWIWDRGFPIKDETGHVYRIAGIAEDITERKQAEEKLQAANRRAVEEYQYLLGHLANLALMFGRARDLLTIYRGLRDFSLSLTPSFALVICLYDEAQRVRKIAYCYLHETEADVSDVVAVPVGNGPAGQAIQSGEAIISNDYFNQIVRRNPIQIGFEEDQRPPQSALIAPMTIMGRTIGTIEVQSHELAAYTREHAVAIQMAANLAANGIENIRLLDLEREREEQLRQSQKMEAVGRLAGGIAHDFNNLLTAINGYSELTMLQLKAEDPLMQNLEEIKKAGDRAASLTRQLLAFSRKQVLQPKVIDLNSLVADIEKMLRRLIGEDIDLQTVLHRELGSIKADPGQIEQVIMNLVVNARDAMPKGGKLTIETRNVYLDQEFAEQHIATNPGPYVMLAISDTGTGMDEQTQARIFDPFFTTKEVGKGTGLGLSTVYGIVKQSGGNLWVYSELGQGSTFKVYLPRIDEGAEEYRRTTENEESLKGTETVLLAEDEEMVRKLAVQVLEMYGYRVLEAANGGTAFLICERHQETIDLLLTDVIMPEMSGRELANRLTELRPDMKVVFMSGYTDDAIVHQGVLDEDENFIQKPFTPSALAQKVREALDKSR